MTANSDDGHGIKSKHIEAPEGNDFCNTISKKTFEPNPVQIESDITRFIRVSVERSLEGESRQTSSAFKQVVEITNNVITEIPIVIDHTNHYIRKFISVGRDGISTINSFKNNWNLKKAY